MNADKSPGISMPIDRHVWISASAAMTKVSGTLDFIGVYRRSSAADPVL
jgi:hypothetical protein